MIDLGPKPVLVLVDVQKGFKQIPPERWSSTDAVSRMAELLDSFRSKGWKVIHVRHDSPKPESRLKAGKPGFEFQDEVVPLEGETVITKHVNSAFIGTDLEQQIRNGNYSAVVVAGLVTEHCISTTARMSGNLGFRTVVPSDACAAYSKVGFDGHEIDGKTVHEVNLASINGEFATVVPTSEVV